MTTTSSVRGRNRLPTVLLPVLFFLLALSLSQAALADTIIYVNQASTAAVPNGQSWDTAYRELTTAIENSNPTAENPVEFWMAKGVYKPTKTTDRRLSFNLPSHIRIRGGFAGYENDANAPRLYQNATVLSGDIGIPMTGAVNTQNYLVGSTIDLDDPGFLDNSYNVIYAVGAKDVLLDFIVVANGNADAGWVARFGSFGFTKSEIQDMVKPKDDVDQPADRTLSQLDPQRTVMGGGMYFQGSPTRDSDVPDLRMNQVTFVNNASAGHGGGVAFVDGFAQVAECFFRQNITENDGAAWYGLNQYADFLSTQFDDNVSGDSGGAVAFRSYTSERNVNLLALEPDPAAKNITRDTRLRANTLFVSLPKQAMKLSEGTSLLNTAYSKLKSLPDVYKAFKKKGLLSLFGPGQPKPRQPEPVLSGGAEFVSGMMELYGYFETFVMVGDIVYAMFDYEGTSTNEYAQAWRQFSNGFNTYATPTGLATFAAFSLADYLSEEFDDPNSVQHVLDLRAWMEKGYNDAAPSSFRFCLFNRNVATGHGGAINSMFDNVRIEGCQFNENGAYSGGALCLSSAITPIVMNEPGPG